MNIKKYLSLVIVAFVLLGVNTYAATLSGTIASGNNSLLTSGYRLLSLDIIGAASGNTTVRLYDLSTSVTNLATGAYSTRTSYATNVVTSYTNTVGSIQSITNSGLFTLTSTVATNLLEAVRIVDVVVPPNVLYQLNMNVPVVKGVSATSSQTITYTLTYGNNL